MKRWENRRNRGWDTNVTAKMGAIGINIILLLLIMTVVFIQQADAKPQYLAALKFVYGDGSCTNCHTDPNGGTLLTEYGSAFKSQPIHTTDSVLALRYIGKPPGAIPANTAVVTIITPAATEITPIVTEIIPVMTTPAVTEIIPVVTIPVVVTTTPAVTDMIPVVTTLPTTNDKNKSVATEKEEENSEKEEVNRQSPGLGTIFTAGIMLIVYTLERLLSKKDEET